MTDALQTHLDTSTDGKFAIRKPRLLSLNGCFSGGIGQRLGVHFDHLHLWRTSIPTLMSEAHRGRNFFPARDVQVGERLNFDLTKQARRQAARFNPDVVILDILSDFPVNYLLRDGCVIADMNNPLFGYENFSWPETFDTGGWEPLSPCTEAYADLWFAYFDQFLNEFTSRKPVEIIFLKRFLCDKQVGAEGISRLPDVDVQAVNLQLQNIYRRLAKYEDRVKLIDLEPEFFFTAPDAPFGPWTYHPAEEVIDIVVFKIIEKFKLDNRYISKFMIPSYLERVQRRAKVAAEKDELARRTTALQAERDALVQQHAAVVGERDTLSSRHEAYVAERTALKQRVQSLESEREEGQKEQQALLTQRDFWAREHAAATAERDALRAQCTAAQSERAALQGQLGQFTAERDAFNTWHAANVAQIEALKARERALGAEKDELHRKLQAHAAERDDWVARQATVTAERDLLAQQLAATTAERDTISTWHAADLAQIEALKARERALGAEKDELHRELQAHAAERDGWVARQATVTAERDLLAQQLAATTAERDTLNIWHAADLAQIEALKARLDALSSEVVQAAQDKAAVAAERDALAAQQQVAMAAEREKLGRELLELTGDRDAVKRRLDEAHVELTAARQCLYELDARARQPLLHRLRRAVARPRP
jgi:hypothetical protein